MLDFVGLPAIIRPSFTLGGTGGGIAYNRDEFVTIVNGGLEASPTTEVLIEESVLGWKEYEMEVVRDRADNAIIICSIENIDPMGVHTGDIDHRRPGADADRQGISAHALGQHRGAARNRGRDRRVQRPVRGRSQDRADGGDRDEPAGVASLGAGVEGDRLPDRQGRGAAGGGLHARRDRQRHHRRRDPGELRADDRLCRDQDPALRVREVQGRRRDPDHLDEVGGRGDGDRTELRREPAEGASRAGDGADRARPGARAGTCRSLGGRSGAVAAGAGPAAGRGGGASPGLHGRADQRDFGLRPVVPRAAEGDRRGGGAGPPPRAAQRRRRDAAA